MPYYDYIRGKIFIEDLRDNFGEDVPYNFDMGVLLHMLYDDFLAQIKKGAKNEEIALYLIRGKEKHFKKKKQKRVMKALTKHIFEFETVEEEDEYFESQESKIAYLELRIRESEVLRGEVLIYDLEPFMKGINVTIEQLISIVYLDFIENVKSEGNSLKVQKSILAHLKRF